MDEFYEGKLPLQDKPERQELYDWMAVEEKYVHAKFHGNQRGDHDETLRDYDISRFWIRQILQYLDRADAFLTAAKLCENERDAYILEKKAQQAVAKCMMTTKSCAESMLRVFGAMPEGGHTSGEIIMDGKSL